MISTRRSLHVTARMHILRRRSTNATIQALAVLALLTGAVSGASSAAMVEGNLRALQSRLAIPAELAQVEQESPDGMVSMFVRGDLDGAQIAALGGALGSADGSYRTVRIPASQVASLLAMKGLQSAQLARHIEYQMIQSVPQTGAALLWKGANGVYTGLTGKGVIVGIIDSGIDFRHKDFLNPNGTTRLISIWDQTVNTTPPAGYTYGGEWTAAQINAGQCTQMDGVGHGTFMASIAAGNGRGTAAGLPAYQYVGMAPEADIIAVKVNPMDTYLVDGIEYVFKKAQALGKPAVVLIASGIRQGSHDGTDPAELRIASLCTTYGPSRLVVSAVGNYGNVPIHAATTVTKGSTASVTLTVPTLPSQDGAPYFKLDGWYPAGHSYSVTVTTPGGRNYGPIAKGVYKDSLGADAQVVIGNGSSTNSKGDPNVYISVQKGLNGQMVAGTYTVKLTTNDASSGPIDFWLGDYSLNSVVPTFVQGMSFNLTAMTPSTGDSVISVGAFTQRNTWVAAGNQTYGLSGFPTAGDIAAWSGRGMRRDGRQLPDLVAPGQAIGGARSSWMAVSGVYILPDSVHMIQTGTSIAAAHVAGGLALELQDAKNRGKSMSVQGARLFLRNAATKDSYYYAVGNADSNLVWGAGKLHLPSGTVGVGDGVPLSLGFAAPFPNPSVGGMTNFEFVLAPADLVGANAVRLEIVDASGRLVRSLAGSYTQGSQRLTWDGKDAQQRSVRPGMYFAHLHVGSKDAVQKFVRLQQ